MHNLLVVDALVQDTICEEQPGNEILQKRFGSFSLLCVWRSSQTRCSVFQVELINQEKIWMDGKEFWLINEKLKQQLKVFPFRAQRGQKGAGEPVWKLNSSKSFPSLQTESTSPVSQRSRSTPLLLNYGFCQPLKWTISIHWYFVIFLLFRCASISWFEVVSNWVSHLPFSASASTGLSDYFLLIGFIRESLNSSSVCKLAIYCPFKFEMHDLFGILWISLVFYSHQVLFAKVLIPRLCVN